METKHLLALIILLVLTCGSVSLALLSHRIRAVMFFLLVFGTIYTERMDVNFFGDYWYRGTSRGVEISLLDVLTFSILVAELLAPRFRQKRWFWPVGLGLLLMYFAWCTISVIAAEPKYYGAWELVKVARSIVLLVACALYVRSRFELGLLVLALGSAVGVEAIYGVKQRIVDGSFRVPGTLDHENSLSMYLCTVAPVLLAAALADWSKWLRWFCGLACAVASLTELLTISRTGIPTFAIGMLGVTFGCISWKITRKKVLIGSLIVLTATAVLAKAWDQLASRYMSASLKEEYLDEQNEGRGIYWRWAAAIVDDHPYGIGLNNWSYYVSKTYGPRLGYAYEDYDEIKVAPQMADLPSIRYAAPAHSLAALTIGELGIPGIILLLLVWFRWFQVGATFLRRRLNADPMHRLGIGCLFATWGIFIHSITEWTYRQTSLMFAYHILAGTMAALYYHRRQARKAEAEAVLEERQDDHEIEIEVEEIPEPVRRSAVA
jgi:hypothetical protein